MKICIRMLKAKAVALVMKQQQSVAYLAGGDGAAFAPGATLGAAPEARWDGTVVLRIRGHNL